MDHGSASQRITGWEGCCGWCCTLRLRLAAPDTKRLQLLCDALPACCERTAAIETADEATNAGAAHFIVNCSPPTLTPRSTTGSGSIVYTESEPTPQSGNTAC